MTTDISTIREACQIRIYLEIDNLIAYYFNQLSKYEGQVCKKCGIIQGQSLKGFKQYYCEHITNKIERKQKDKKKIISIKMLDLIKSANKESI